MKTNIYIIVEIDFNTHVRRLAGVYETQNEAMKICVELGKYWKHTYLVQSVQIEF